MKERFLESLAILLAGLFSAERPRPWRLGDPAPNPKSATKDADAATEAPKRAQN